MKLIYIDESGTFNDGLSVEEAKANTQKSRRKSTHFVLSAIIIDVDKWTILFKHLKSLRADIWHNYHISKSEQLHANELIGGKGVWRHEKYAHLDSAKRKKLLKYILKSYSTWPEVSVISAVVDKLTGHKSINPTTARNLAYENILNRIEKTLGDEKYLIIIDGQEDFDVIKITRRMKVYNPIKGNNILVKALVEDPLFKMAKASYVLQMIDHIAYATLHIFDERLNLNIARDLLETNLYHSIGVNAVHGATAKLLPGVILIPKLTEANISIILKKSLGQSPDSSSGARLAL